MAIQSNKIRILVFIGTLWAGGKERRLVELLTYISKSDRFEVLVILTDEDIHFKRFYELNIPFKVIKPINLSVFLKLYRICKAFNPHLIHTWGRMQTFYMLPTVLLKNTLLINSQIASAPSKRSRISFERLIDLINFRFSHTIISNSRAGIEVFRPPQGKCAVIYNGVNLNRFVNLPDPASVRLKYSIATPYAIVMAASFSPNKDYDLFHKVASLVIQQRQDVTFIGVGESQNDKSFDLFLAKTQGTPRFLLPGRIEDVEALVNASTIGVLFSTNGEGISNAIMEYMALGKPVIANKAGGTTELVRHQENGFLIEHETPQEIAALIHKLLDDEELRASFGKRSREIVLENFSLEKMGRSFEQLYSRHVNTNHTLQIQ